MRLPIYVYKCVQCAKVLEVTQKVNDKPLEDCPECSGELRKQMTAAAAHFKGTGFYQTDYKARGK